MSHHGKYFPRHPKKYKGNPTNIFYRSSWEKKFMNWCDLTESVSEWQSEEFFIPYRSPIDGRVHRYYPDFFVKYKDSHGKRRVLVIEVKPKKETKMPTTNPKRRTKSWAYSVRTYAINQAKWKAAKEFCKDHNYEFKIMTEHEFGIR